MTLTTLARAKAEAESQTILKGLLNKIKTRKMQQRNQTSGKLNKRLLIRNLSGNGGILTTTKLFIKSKTLGKEHDVLILVDLSGSTGTIFSYNQDGSPKTRNEQAQESVYNLSLILSGIGANFSIYGFSSANRYGKINLAGTTYLYEVKPFNKTQAKEDIINKINTLLQEGEWKGDHEATENNDLKALLMAEDILKKKGNPANKKIIIMISDGCPNVIIQTEDGRELQDMHSLESATISTINEIQKRGIKILAVSVSNEANNFLKEAGYFKNVFIGDTETARAKFTGNLIKAYLEITGGKK